MNINIKYAGSQLWWHPQTKTNLFSDDLDYNHNLARNER